MNPFLNDSHSRSVLLYIIDALLIYLAYYLVFIFRFYLADDASVFNNLTPDDLNWHSYGSFMV